MNLRPLNGMTNFFGPVQSLKIVFTLEYLQCKLKGIHIAISNSR